MVLQSSSWNSLGTITVKEDFNGGLIHQNLKKVGVLPHRNETNELVHLEMLRVTTKSSEIFLFAVWILHTWVPDLLRFLRSMVYLGFDFRIETPPPPPGVYILVQTCTPITHLEILFLIIRIRHVCQIRTIELSPGRIEYLIRVLIQHCPVFETLLTLCLISNKNEIWNGMMNAI